MTIKAPSRETCKAQGFCPECSVDHEDCGMVPGCPCCEETIGAAPVMLRFPGFPPIRGVGPVIVAKENCPQCGAPIREKMSGVECSARCGWWFCY